jgi:hypothetical protein
MCLPDCHSVPQLQWNCTNLAENQLLHDCAWVPLWPGCLLQKFREKTSKHWHYSNLGTTCTLSPSLRELTSVDDGSRRSDSG